MAADRPLVSVVLPVFNGMPYLPQAVESILSQTCSAWEMIVVNDGSTDGSADYLRRAAAGEPRLRLVEHPENRGVAAAYNSGIALARGRYIAFQEQDDISLPFRLEREIAALERYDAPVVSARVGQLDQSDVLYAYWPPDIGAEVEVNPPGYRLSHRILIRHTNIANSTMMLDRERLAPGDLAFDEAFRRSCQDADLQMRLVLKYPTVRLAEVLVHMRRFKEQSSATSDALALVPDLRRLLGKHGPRLHRTAPPLAAFASLCRAWSNQMLFEARCRRRSWRGWAQALAALVLWPSNPEIRQAVRKRAAGGRSRHSLTPPPGGA